MKNRHRSNTKQCKAWLKSFHGQSLREDQGGSSELRAADWKGTLGDLELETQQAQQGEGAVQKNTGP